MNGFELFAQIKFFLPLVYVLSYLRADLAFYLGNFQLARQKFCKFREPLRRNALFQKRLTAAFLEREHGKHVVYKLVGIGHFRKLDEHVLGKLFVEEREFQHGLPREAEIGLRFRAFLFYIVFAHGIRAEHAVFRLDIFGVRPIEGLHAHFHAAPGQFDDLRYARDHAVSVQIGLGGRIDEGVFLRRDEQLRAVFRRRVDRGERDLPAHVEIDKGLGEYHLAAQGDHGQIFHRFPDRRFIFYIFHSSPLFLFPPFRQRQYFFKSTSTGFSAKGTVTSSAAACRRGLPSPTATP